MLERMTCSGEEDIYVAEAQSEWRKGQEVAWEREVRAVVHARLQGCDFILGWGRGGSIGVMLQSPTGVCARE